MRAGEGGQAAAPEGGAEAPAGDPAPRERPEELARQGRFGEAVHLLLLDAFHALAGARGLAVAPASTGRELGRELARRLELEGQRARSLSELVRQVEMVLFADRSPDRAAYEACREHHRRLLAADPSPDTAGEAAP